MKSLKYFLTAIFLFGFFALIANAQEKVTKHKDHQQDTKTEVKSTSKKTDDIVRKGVINLKKIDENKDGKVFQDQMCWNVISDKAGKCPLCKMVLQEVSLDDAKKNLKENDYKVK